MLRTPGRCRAALVPHPLTPCDAIEQINVSADRFGDHLRMKFRLLGDLSQIELPQHFGGKRRHFLWRNTCLEAFVRAPRSPAYLELNASPSRDWAAYAFGGYRKHRRNAAITQPEIRVRRTHRHMSMTVTINLPQSLRRARRLEIGPSAVIENVDGRRSYWAVRHARPAPDFHHPVSFALTL